MKNIGVSDAKKKFYRLLDEVAISHEPIKIKGEGSNGILMSEDYWRSIKETLYLYSVPGMRESIVEGIETPLSKIGKKFI